MNEDRNRHAQGQPIMGHAYGFRDVRLPARTDGVAAALRGAYGFGGDFANGSEISRLLAELDRKTASNPDPS